MGDTMFDSARELLAQLFLSGVLSLALYVLMAWSLQTLARRRGIRRTWLAWLPVGGEWILGCVADDYQQRVFGRRRSYRKLLLWLTAATLVLSGVTLALCAAVLGELAEFFPKGALEKVAEGYLFGELSPQEFESAMDAIPLVLPDGLTEEAAATRLLGRLTLMTGVSLLTAGVSIAAAVFQYLCLADLFGSCLPRFKLVLLLVSILTGYSAVAVFLCRHKDEGMTPPAPWGPPGLPGRM